MTRTLTTLLFLLTAGTAVGCGSNELDDPAHVRAWANAGSAVGVYVHVYEPIAFADGESMFMDPACPDVRDDGTTVTIAGGCTDTTGTTWTGTATVVREADGARSVSLNEYSHFDDMPGATVTGTATVRPIMGGSVHEFEADYVHEGGITTTVDYTGTVAGSYDSATTWNGSGLIERDGLAQPTGVVRTTTVDEVLDDAACRGQAASGQTTIESGDQTATVTYDGATDCDEDKAARWSFEGEDRGLVTGIVCSAVGPGMPGSAPVAALAVLGLLALVRRSR